MKVAWSYVALGNIIEANKYIASENPEAARKIINDIFEAGNKINAFPEKGRIVPKLWRKDVREIFCHEYRIIYRIKSKRIFVLIVLHMKKLLKEKVIKAIAGV